MHVVTYMLGYALLLVFHFVTSIIFLVVKPFARKGKEDRGTDEGEGNITAKF